MKVDMNKLTPSEFNSYFNSLSQEERDKIFSEPQVMLELQDNVFFMAFQRQTSKTKQKLLENQTIAKKILIGNQNARVNSTFDYLEPEEQQILCNHTNLLIQIKEQILEQILKKAPTSITDKLIEKLHLEIKQNTMMQSNIKLQAIQKIYNNDFSFEEIIKIWNITSIETYQQFFTYCKQNKREALNLLKINTDDEFTVYVKTNCILTQKEIETQKIPLDIINRINNKNLVKLITLYKEHLKNNQYTLTDAQILITVLNTYLIFGYDNARKILLDFFTYATEASKIQQANLEFSEQRKEYRLTHQNEFYSHQMIERLYQEFVMIVNEEIEAENSRFFQQILQSKSKEACKNLYKELIALIRTSNTDRNTTISNFLKDKIQQREETLKQIYIEQTKETNIIPVTEVTLYQIFKGLDYHKCSLDPLGNPIINPKITSFFLGNERKKNDCLLRMIISKNFFDLKDHVIPIINCFTMIENEIKRANGYLSMNSLNDVIRIYQTTSYSLDYDEQDISLSTIAKIKKSVDFIENPEINIVEEMLKYHKLRKWKTNLTIPYVSGTTMQGIKYKILKNDSEKLLTSGIDHNCCFKPGAKGEQFFQYCLTNPNGGIVYLEDLTTEQSFIVPFIVNGNTIYGNGIEPKIESSNKQLSFKLLEAIQECYQAISQESSSYETIDIGILSNLHLEKEHFIQDYPKLTIDQNPAEEEFYCDLIKKDKIKYIVFQKEKTSSIMHYPRKSKYEQSRKKTFIYTKAEYTSNSQDLKDLERKINNIYYTYLKFKKQLDPQNFQPLHLNQWELAIGNDDWFILKSKTDRLECILPYYQDIDIEIEVALQYLEKKERNLYEGKNY